ncbi:MAG: OPT family oligopeptide transporter, partial [Caldanaerobacter sp.]
MAKAKESDNRKLSHEAYGGVHGSEYIPFIPADKVLPELTVVAVIVGSLFAIIFAAANAYLGLKAGMTISAAIPAAVLATALLKGLFKRNSILEANLVMAIAATGESLAGGIIFTLPAIVLWGLKDQFTLSRIVFVILIGGLLGALFVIPLRRYLTVEEHGKLIYPEGMAAAEVLVTSNQGGTGFMTVLSGMIVGGIYKLLSGGFGMWSESPSWVIKRFESTEVGVNVLASLMGVGFIVGLDVAMYMLAGSVLAWLGLIPLIKFFGAGLTTPVYPATDLIRDMSAGAIWSKYIRYIGAGGVLAGGFISLIKALPTIIKAFRESIVGLGMKGKEVKRTDIDVSLTWVIFGAAFVFFVAWLMPSFGVTALGSLMAVLFAFFFAVVSARITGLVGVSNNPISGMTIATLLIVTSVLKLAGIVGNEGMIIAITIGGIVCVAAAIAGANAQSLKTTFIIGGTPKHIEVFTYVGIAVASVFAGLVLILLNNAYG